MFSILLVILCSYFGGFCVAGLVAYWFSDWLRVRFGWFHSLVYVCTLCVGLAWPVVLFAGTFCDCWLFMVYYCCWLWFDLVVCCFVWFGGGDYFVRLLMFYAGFGSLVVRC